MTVDVLPPCVTNIINGGPRVPKGPEISTTDPKKNLVTDLLRQSVYDTLDITHKTSVV